MTLSPQAGVLSLESSPRTSINLDNAGRAFGWFCVLHVLVWTLVPALMYHNPPKDSLEGIAWGHMWQLGYEKHPFLAPWLTALFTDVFGTVGWPIYFLSQLSVVLCFWAVHRIALPVVGKERALLAVLILDGVYYYGVGAIPFNPNVAMLPTWALLIWAFREALLRPDVFRWLRAGAFAGLATLAKYESAILFVVLLGALGILPEGRRALRGRAFYWGIAAAVAVAGPNLYWLVKHDFAPFHYALNNLNLEQNVYTEAAEVQAPGGLYPPLLFLLEQLGALVPMALLYLPFVRWDRRDFGLRSFDRRFVFIMATGPLLATVLFAVATDAKLIARWGFPFFSLAGLALILAFPPELSPARWRRFFVGLLALLALTVGGCYWAIFVRPVHTGMAPYSIAYPGRAVSDYALSRWHARHSTPLRYIAGDRWVISTISAFSTEKPIPYFELNPAQSPWLVEADVRRAGAVLVQPIKGRPGDEETIRAIRERFPTLQDEIVASFAQHTDATVPPVRLWIAVLPPAVGEAPGAVTGVRAQ